MWEPYYTNGNWKEEVGKEGVTICLLLNNSITIRRAVPNDTLKYSWQNSSNDDE